MVETNDANNGQLPNEFTVSSERIIPDALSNPQRLRPTDADLEATPDWKHERRERYQKVIGTIEATAFQAGVGELGRAYWDQYAQRVNMPDQSSSNRFRALPAEQQYDMLNRTKGLLSPVEFAEVVQGCQSPQLAEELFEMGNASASLLEQIRTEQQIREQSGNNESVDTTEDLRSLIERTIQKAKTKWS